MSQENGLIGFWSGSSGVGYENGWITDDQIDRFVNEWLISSQQPSLYRGNFNNYTISTSPGLSESTNILGINTGWSSEYSDYGFAELLVFNQLLNIQSIQCIEQYLDDKYGLNYIPTQSPITSKPTSAPTETSSVAPTEITSFEPTENPSVEPTVSATTDNLIPTATEISKRPTSSIVSSKEPTVMKNNGTFCKRHKLIRNVTILLSLFFCFVL